MKKTILLGTRQINIHRNVIISVSLGVIFIINGVISMKRGGPFGLILGVLTMVGGLWYIVYALLAFNKYSKFAPRFTLDEKELLFKETLFRRPVRFFWNKIRRIELGPYQLLISTDDSNQTLYYSTRASTSKEIKSAIREIAESKQIEVIGG
ncbi:MAG: hypothetical protein ACFHWX_17720 [Bacteroidota bacterium]